MVMKALPAGEVIAMTAVLGGMLTPKFNFSCNFSLYGALNFC